MNGEHERTPHRPADAARAWRAALPHDLRRSSNVRGGLIFTLQASLYLLLFLGTFLLPSPWLRFAAVAFMPLVIGGLFVIGHDACHGTLVASGRGNRLLGRLALLPAWHPFSSWVYSHNTLHHGWTNLKGREPAFPPFTKEEYDALPAWRRLLERFYRSPAGVGIFYAVDFYLKRLLFPRVGHRPPQRRAFQRDRLLVLGFFAAQLTAAWFLSGLTPDRRTPRALLTIFAVVPPWVVWVWFMGFVSYIQHTHPRMAWYDNVEEWTFYHVQLRSTAHVVFPWPVERLLNNIMDHPAHHLDPGIPLYELPRGQQLLERSCPEHAVVIHWTPADFLRTCAACKLYDFRRHCWTDFTGTPTTPLGLSGLPSGSSPTVASPTIP
jgi:omega-6 fatty acid desaturase (delta-12 desaturase)